MDPRHALAASVIVLTYAGVALGEFPQLRMNRATIALVGAVVLVAAGGIGAPQAFAALDGNTLVLLFAMMVLNVHLRLAGFFNWIAALVVRHAGSPRCLLGWIIIASGVLSALFLNDTVVLMFTPLVVQVAQRLRRNPIPYLMALATSANIGSAATITGNPQNMLIGMSSHIAYLDFARALVPVSLAGMLIAWVVIVGVYRAEFAERRFPERYDMAAEIYTPLFRKTVTLSGLLLAAFLLGAPIPLAALTVAAALLVTRRLKPSRIFAQIDWSLLVFFSGLFVVTGAIGALGFSDDLFAVAEPLARGGVLPLSAVTVVLSNLVSNVPAVLLFRPLVPQFADPGRTWLVLAMASTLAGNLTLLGSVANLIVAESARSQGVRLSFGEYLKVGAPVTVLSLAAGVIWLSML
ncbi:MAG: anion transporter [Chloroflexi bacterium]|nr:anion transporter [Chloroflexota bacterium]